MFSSIVHVIGLLKIITTVEFEEFEANIIAS